MDDILNTVTMIPGFVMAIYFLPSIPWQAVSYMMFCICSMNYHIARHVNAAYTDLAFKYDILSQLVACMYNANGYGKLYVIPYWWFSFNGIKNKNMTYVINAICILSVVYPCSEAFKAMLVAFLFFIMGGVTGSPFMHSVFHIFGHVSVYYYWKYLE